MTLCSYIENYVRFSTFADVEHWMVLKINEHIVDVVILCVDVDFRAISIFDILIFSFGKVKSFWLYLYILFINTPITFNISQPF